VRVLGLGPKTVSVAAGRLLRQVTTSGQPKSDERSLRQGLAPLMFVGGPQPVRAAHGASVAAERDDVDGAMTAKSPIDLVNFTQHDVVAYDDADEIVLRVPVSGATARIAESGAARAAGFLRPTDPVALGQFEDGGHHAGGA